MKQRPLVGLLVNDLVGSYQYGHWMGMKAQAAEEGCDLVSLNGGELGSADPTKRMRNAAFQLASPDDVDCLLVMAPAVANCLEQPAIDAFLGSLAPIPLVVAGMELPGRPCVVVDNRAGMEAVVEHVVGFHGRKRPAYLGGPERNPEAAQRKAAFRDVLAKHGLAVDPTLEMVADFDFGIGRARIRDLLDRGVEFDAVVAANDEMALGALEALKERGRSVPEDVIVTGFDDIEDARFSTPALTSVRQPVVDQGRTGLKLALALVRGEAVAPVTRQPATLVARGSCGCHSKSIEEVRPASGTHLLPGGGEGRPVFGGTEHRDALMAACIEGPRDEILREWIGPLVAEFADDLRTPGGDSTIQAFERMMERCAQGEEDTDRWQVFVSRMRKASRPFLLPADQPRESEIVHQLRVLAHERAVQRTAYKAVQIERWTRQLHETGSHLITSFDVEKLIASLGDDLGLLQLSSCHILLREPEADDSLRWILAAAGGKRIALPRGGELVKTRGLLRDLALRVDGGTALAVEPLFFEGTQLGFAVLELAPRRGMLLDAVRTQVSAALMGARLAQEVSARTLELEEALETLRRNQTQLVLSEKMASLGKLTAGIAHEMNTPLAAVRGSLEELRKLVEEYRDSVGDGSVNDDDHRAIAADMLKSLDIATRAGEKASGFVRSIKTQTRDMGAKDKQVFDVVKVVDEAILLLSHALRKARCEIRTDYRVRPAKVLGIPDRLAQVVTNLATNAIDAMESKGGGIVTVAVAVEGGEVRLSVADQGTGIAEENLVRIFDPLFTTKPVGKGTGLGLTIIHDIVHGDFGGTISVESRQGTGTTFTVVLPAARED
jgi:signal transduction histidine kinase/DNA-binding LacI/PurR family transcriptional regulator